MTASAAARPRRGEVWVVRLDPAEGHEMKKRRPAVVVSSDAAGALPVRLVAPCTTTGLPEAAWRIPVRATHDNGLDRDTTIDLMQLRALGDHRLLKRLGRLTDEEMVEVATAIATLVEYE